MKGSGYRSVLSVILAVIVTYAYAQSQSEERCIPADNGYDFLSCDFEKDFCRWKNAEDNTFDWKGDHEAFDIFDDHATAESNEAGSTARLESPWLCATGTNFTSLKFDYYMGQDPGNCRLSVQIKTELNTVNIVTRTSHEGRGFETVGPEYITCPDNKFKIVFEAEKLTSEQCGSTTEGIDIDDVIVLVEQDKPSPGQVHTCSVLPTTTQPLDTSVPELPTTAGWISKNTFTTTEGKVSTSHLDVSVPFPSTIKDGEQNRQTGDENDGLSVGAVAGIVVALVVVAAVIALVVFFLLRRKRGEKSSRTSEREDPSGAVSNLACSPTDDPDTGEYETPHDYQNTHPEPQTSSSTYYNAPAVSSAVSGATAENYETLAAARPQSTGHYTQLSTKKQDQPVMRSEDNETLATSPSSPYYLTLIADNQVQDAARNETYEQLMARPPSDHYTALNTGKSPRTK